MPKAKRAKWPEITWSSCPESKLKDAPRILGLNPWIYDFAAFNLWSRPAGLLWTLGLLRQAGAKVALLDCLDKTWADYPWPQAQKWGQGHYPKKKVPKPAFLSTVPRNFSRYGLDYKAVKVALQKISPPPDMVLISSIMTYWYPGVITLLHLVKEIWPRIPVVLGGIYATLCTEHAQKTGADLVVKGRVEEIKNWQALWKLLGVSPPSLSGVEDLLLPWELYPEAQFSVLLGSRGCPFDCDYCASNKLYSGFWQRSFEVILKEFSLEYEKGVRNFAFYDDALLVNPEHWLFPFLNYIIEKKLEVNLHTPNALHLRYLDLPTCKKLFQAGLKTVRLGLESANFSSRLDRKLSLEHWERGVRNLLQAGFKKEWIKAYVLFGLPGQEEGEVKEAIRFVKKWGITPELAYFSPIPGTKIFTLARQCSPFPLEEEPLFQNNSLWPCVPGGFSWEKAGELKALIKS